MRRNPSAGRSRRPQPPPADAAVAATNAAFGDVEGDWRDLPLGEAMERCGRALDMTSGGDPAVGGTGSAIRCAARSEPFCRDLAVVAVRDVDVDALRRFFERVKAERPSYCLDLFHRIREFDDWMSRSGRGRGLPAVAVTLNEGTFAPFRNIERDPAAFASQPYLPGMAYAGTPWPPHPDEAVPEGLGMDIWQAVGAYALAPNDVLVIEELGPGDAEGGTSTLAPLALRRSAPRLDRLAVRSRIVAAVVEASPSELVLEEMHRRPAPEGPWTSPVHVVKRRDIAALASTGRHVLLRLAGRGARRPGTVERNARIEALLADPRRRAFAERVVSALRRDGLDRVMQPRLEQGRGPRAAPEWLLRRIERRFGPTSRSGWGDAVLPAPAVRRSGGTPRHRKDLRGSSWEAWTEDGTDRPLAGDVLIVVDTVPLSWPSFVVHGRAVPSGRTANDLVQRTLLLEVCDDGGDVPCDVLWCGCQDIAHRLPRYASFPLRSASVSRLGSVLRLAADGSAVREAAAAARERRARLDRAAAGVDGLAEAVDPETGLRLGAVEATRVLQGDAPVRRWMIDWFG